MTRTEFLKSQWYKYPVFSAAMPPNKETWLTGRLQAVNSKYIELAGQTVPIVGSSLVNICGLGVCAPYTVLQINDIVAYNVDRQCVFLLAPDLNGESILSSIEWQMYLHVVHDFFSQIGFVHWLTPTLVMSSGVDANIDFFYAQGVRTQRQYRLPTSPEFELKKALVQGIERVFEIKKCFRDDDEGPLHKAEFTMLEWYRAFATLEEIEQDVLNLVHHIVSAFALPLETLKEFRRFTMKDLFAQYLQFSLTPTTTKEELVAALEKYELSWSQNDDWNDLFFRLYVDRVEPFLKELGPIVVSGFPAQQRSLARITADGWADRFEFYWDGVEIANAYNEENNPEVITNSIQIEMESRIKSNRAALHFDEHFVKTMKSGLPPSAGIALGLERLFMCLNNKSEIQTIY